MMCIPRPIKKIKIYRMRTGQEGYFQLRRIFSQKG